MHKKKQATKTEVFVANGGAWCVIHKDDHHAWIVSYDLRKKIVGGGVKKVTRDFLMSQELCILAV